MGNSISAAGLPYSVGEKIAVSEDGWALHRGRDKSSPVSDPAAVSVFFARKTALSKDSRGSNRAQLAPALRHFSQCKRLRHPHILKVYATLDTDAETSKADVSITDNAKENNEMTFGGDNDEETKAETGDLIIVTEPCIPLNIWFQTSPSFEQRLWGLECVLKALHFLHGSAGLIHGNLSPASLYVTPAGDVKLWNFSLVTASEGELSSHFCQYESLMTPLAFRSPERKEGLWEEIAVAGLQTIDSFGLGVLIGHFFKGQEEKIPCPLVEAMKRLRTPNFAKRPKRFQSLWKQGSIFETPYRNIQLKLEVLQIQSVPDKVAFWHTIMKMIKQGGGPSLPPSMCVHKLLPLMKDFIRIICESPSMREMSTYLSEVSSIMEPMFYIAENYLTANEFANEMTDTVTALFSLKGRGIRGALLEKTALLACRLDAVALNNKIFEELCTGFSDSCPAIRELTLKGSSALVPHLSELNMEALSRHLVRLQSDCEPSVRTCTVLFVAQSAPDFTQTWRHKLLMHTYDRSMKDSHGATKLAALRSIGQTKQFFSPAMVATRVLPAVTPLLLDEAAAVRREAFKLVDDLLFVIRQESEKMSTTAEALSNESSLTLTATTSPIVSIPTPVTAQGATEERSSSCSGFSLFSSWMSSSGRGGPFLTQ